MLNFVIVGCPRSGTSLLRCMLDSHPEIAIPHETHFIDKILQFDWEKDRFAAVDFLLTHHGFPSLKIEETFILETAINSQTAVSFLHSLYSQYGNVRSKSIVGDKSPKMALSVGLISKHIPSIKIIHIIRNPVDVASSLLKAKFGPDTLEESSSLWVDVVNSVHKQKQRGSLVHEVYYEDLIDNTNIVLTEISDFLGVSFSTRMLEYSSSATDFVRQNWHPESHNRLFEAPTKKINEEFEEIYQQLISIKDVRSVMERHGYLKTCQL